MGSMTLTGPAASFDRSTSEGWSFSWTATRVNEELARWRVQYRTVGSGTWLYAYDNNDNNVLVNASAEAGNINDWQAAPLGVSQAIQAGNRYVGGGSWKLNQTVTDLAYHYGAHSSGRFAYPGAGNLANAPVVAGATYLVNTWIMGNVGSYSSSWKTETSVDWYNASGVYISTSHSQAAQMIQATNWQQNAIEVVAPAGAAFAKVYCTWMSTKALGVGAQADDWTMERIDNVPRVVTGGTVDVWSFKYPGPPRSGCTESFPASFFSAGNYEMRVEYVTQAYGLDPATFYSNTVTFTAVTAPTAPTITVPVNNAVIPTETSNVTFTHATAQTDVQVRVMNGAAVEWDSGTVAISTAATSSTVLASFGTNSVPRVIQARTRTGGVWSAWASRNVTVSWTLPAVPTVTAVGEDTQAFGMNHAVRVTVTNPTPTGTQPVVTSYEVRWRRMAYWPAERTMGTQTAGQPLVWYLPPGESIQVRVTVRADNGTTRENAAWITVTPSPSIKGVALTDMDDQTTSTLVFRYNDDGAIDKHEVESALMQFSGREYPVAEFGPATTRNIEVPTLHLKTDAHLFALRLMLTRRTLVAYRDKRGRAVAGLLKLGGIRDTSYGYEVSLSIDVVDSWGA